MSLLDWSLARIVFTVLFSLLLVSGAYLIVVDAGGAQTSPMRYLFVALDAVVVGLLVFRPDILPDAIAD